MKNFKVVMFSFFALGFIALAIFVNWLFIIGAIILMILNQKELMKKIKNQHCVHITFNIPD